MSREPPYDEIALQILEIGRIAATRLDDRRIARFRLDIERQRVVIGDYEYFRDWLRIVDAGPAAIARAFLDPSERGRYLRAVASFRAIVTRDERDIIFKRHLVPSAFRLPFA